ncbi:MAG: hypothetical protein NC215_00260 [Ruminococcus sp.]|nr:hypothetical protein [Ruminococcus sp.]
MSDTLEHHGIKGMKWGEQNGPPYPIDRSQNQNQSQARSEKDARKERKREMKKASKNRRTLSDEEIKKRIERIKLEKQLKDMTKEEIKPGSKFVADVLSQSGKKVATTVVTGAMLYLIKGGLTKEWNGKEAAGYIAPKPKNK